MNNRLLMMTIVAMTCLGLSACARNISPDVVSASDANSVQTAVEGVIVSERVVTVKNDDNMVGTLAGAGIGAVAGSAVGGGNMRIITGIAGAVAGGVAGNAIEDNVTTQKGIEYIVKLTPQSGSNKKSAGNRYVNVIQGQGQQMLQVGQKVLVAGVNSGHAHIIATL